MLEFFISNRELGATGNHPSAICVKVKNCLRQADSRDASRSSIYDYGIVIVVVRPQKYLQTRDDIFNGTFEE